MCAFPSCTARELPAGVAAVAEQAPVVDGCSASSSCVAAHEDGLLQFTKADVDASGDVSEAEFLMWWGEYKRLLDLTSASMWQASADFWEAFFNMYAMIIATELGDKTFFIAAILSMQHGPGVIFCGAITALAGMTMLGVGVGFVLPSLLSRKYTHHAATLLFVYFGLKLLKEGGEMFVRGEGTGPSDELEEVEKEMKESNGDTDDKDPVKKPGKKDANSGFKNIFWQAMTLTFVAEWGDRSQIATIALASTKDPTGVTLGGIAGHICSTGLACLGGKVIAGRISERTVLVAGGILCLLFAVHSVIVGPDVE